MGSSSENFGNLWTLSKRKSFFIVDNAFGYPVPQGSRHVTHVVERRSKDNPHWPGQCNQPFAALTLLNVGWTNRAAALLNFHGRCTEHWRTRSFSADRFAVISTIAWCALVSLPQFCLSVVFLCHCVIALAGRFHNYAVKCKAQVPSIFFANGYALWKKFREIV